MADEEVSITKLKINESLTNTVKCHILNFWEILHKT